MSEQKITTQEPKHSDELLQAVERTLASHNLRLKPGQSLADVADAFEANQVKLSVAHELIKQYQRFVPSYASGAVPATAMLVGAWAGSGPEDYELIKINGPVLKRKVVLESIGCGDILAKYITARLIRPKTWLALSVPVGLYVIDQVKQYVEGCGGDTQLVAMYSTGHIETYTGQQAQEETERLVKIDYELRHIFGRLTDRYNSIEQFRTLFAADLKDVEELVKIEPSSSPD